MSRDAGVRKFDRGKPIGLPHVKGSLQTKSLFVFDEHAKSLVRRTCSVWNTCPREELDFTWIPKVIEADAPGLVTGAGRLIWRLKGMPAYDHGSIYAEYAGEMKDGRPSGKGTYFDRAGFRYEGTWSAGLCEGSGRLQLPNGDEYRGLFRDGRAHGEGIYFRSDGEIYTGHFEYGLRNGSARITLANGSSYSSRWIEDAEHPDSRNFRLSQLGPATRASDDVRLGVLVDTSPLKEGMLGYKSSGTMDGLVIRPSDDRLMELWKGSADIEYEAPPFVPGGIWSGAGLAPDGLLPVLLVLDLENRGSGPIEVVNAYLDVAKSATDFEPLVVITYSYCAYANFEPNFIIYNYGWTALEQASVRLAFRKPGQPPDANEPLWSHQLGAVEGTADVNVEDKLRTVGVNVEASRRRGFNDLSCPSKSGQECFSEVLHSGLFGRAVPYVTKDGDFIRAILAGSLQYKWKDNSGTLKARESPCTVRVILGTLGSAFECEGGDIEFVQTKAPLMLRLDQTSYKVPFDFHTKIEAGRVARVSLSVRASKSSNHDFNVVLVLADGREIRSRPIDLLYFVPNLWGRK